MSLVDEYGRCGPLEVGIECAVEESEDGDVPLAGGFDDTPESFGLPLTLGSTCSLGELAGDHDRSQRTFGEVVRRFDPGVLHEGEPSRCLRDDPLRQRGRLPAALHRPRLPYQLLMQLLHPSPVDSIVELVATVVEPED